MVSGHRGVSTVADVALALLLVGAAVVVLAGAADSGVSGHPNDRAPTTAQAVTAATVSVTYTPELGGETGDVTGMSTRSVQGSVGELLADAAASNATLDGSPVSVGAERYAEAVSAAAVGAFPTGGRTRVVATWRPYDSAALGGSIAAGHTPPPDADVSVATLNVPTRIESVDDDRLAAAYDSGGYDRAARLVARAVVDGFLPPEETQLALEGRGATRALAVARYERFGSAVGVTFDAGRGVLGRTTADAPGANARLVDALIPRLAADMERALSPRVTNGTELAAAVSVDEATVAVYTWER